MALYRVVSLNSARIGFSYRDPTGYADGSCVWLHYVESEVQWKKAPDEHSPGDANWPQKEDLLPAHANGNLS